MPAAGEDIQELCDLVERINTIRERLALNGLGTKFQTVEITFAGIKTQRLGATVSKPVGDGG